MIQELQLKDINRSGGTQIRAAYDRPTIDRYKDLWEAYVELPPIIVFFDGTTYWLADGFHRVEARWEMVEVFAEGKKEERRIKSEVRTGTQRDTIQFALSANADHGLPRSPDDIRRAVTRCLDDAEWSKLTNVKIASMCRCSESMVRKMKGERKPSDSTNDEAPIKKSEINRVVSSNPVPYRVSKPTPQPTEIDPEDAEIGDVLANNPSPVPEPVELIPECDFKVGDRVLDADDRAGRVTNVYRYRDGWHLELKLDSDYEQKGAVELYRLEPKLEDKWAFFYVLVKPELNNSIATFSKKNGYQYTKLDNAIGNEDLVCSKIKSSIQSIADREGGVVKKIVISLEDCQ
jgi:hypothetical protein